MNISVDYEKIFFKWIEQNPEYYKEVSSSYFENNEIREIYRTTKKLILQSEYNEISLFQVKLELNDNGIYLDDEVIERIFDFSIDKIGTDWLESKFKGWVIKKRLEFELTKAIENYKNLETNLDYESNYDLLTSFKKEIDNVNVNFLDNEKFCLDFDNIEDHIQPPEIEKISTGYPEFDEFMGGGFAPQTVHLLVGRTNIGKSIFLQNFALNAKNKGYNVLILSLEMSESSIMKRLGCMAMNIKTNEYSSLLLKDLEKKLKDVYKVKGFGDIETSKGILKIKNKPASSCTISEIKEIIKKYEEFYNVKLNFLVLDYFNLIPSENKNASIYEKGKDNIEGLRSLAQEMNIAVLTATQVTKDKLKDAKAGTKLEKEIQISLGDLSESKAVPDTVDSIWAIEQTTEQRQKGLYDLRHLKNRDGRIADKLVRVYYDYTTLKINNIKFDYDENEI